MQGRFRNLDGTEMQQYIEKGLQKIVDYLQRTNSTNEGLYQAVSCKDPATDSVVYLQPGSHIIRITEIQNHLSTTKLVEP